MKQRRFFLEAWPWLASAASGVLAGLAYPPFGWDWLIWVCLVPLVSAVWFEPARGGKTSLRHFGYGWLAGSLSFWINLGWLIEVTGGGWFLLSVYCGLYTGLFAVFLGLVVCRRDGGAGAKNPWLSSRANLRVALGGAAAWAGLEWVRGVAFSGFGWNGLGVALWESIPLVQVADLTGVPGVSFLVCLTNLILVASVKRLSLEIGKGGMKPHYDFTLCLGLVALSFTYGLRQLLEKPHGEIPLRVAAVQANIPQNEKWDPGFERKILDIYRWQTEVAIAMNPDLLVWPEASMPRAVFSDQTVWSLVSGLAEKWGGDFLLGTVHFADDGDFNAALLLGDRGRDKQFYYKTHLVPFGEYIPFRGTFPLFEWVIGDLVPSDFDAGSGFPLLTMRGKPVKIGSLICFEDTLGGVAREFVLAGAQMFVTTTNDGWFGRSAGSVQHLAQSVFRCAEGGIPMLRCANTGVTCWIDRNGRVVDSLEVGGDTFIEGVFFGEFAVPEKVAPTFYAKNGDIFSWVCLAYAGALAVVAARKKRQVRCDIS